MLAQIVCLSFTFTLFIKAMNISKILHCRHQFIEKGHSQLLRSLHTENKKKGPRSLSFYSCGERSFIYLEKKTRLVESKNKNIKIKLGLKSVRP